uniref:Uncharacterized protein n=1 Tax=Cacopsylla melanoneura TaxID=428564 RepID=A0A8D8R4L9_9HEMI
MSAIITNCIMLDLESQLIHCLVSFPGEAITTWTDLIKPLLPVSIMSLLVVSLSSLVSIITTGIGNNIRISITSSLRSYRHCVLNYLPINFLKGCTLLLTTPKPKVFYSKSIHHNES